MLLLCYPKRSACQKAKAFLEAKGVSYESRDIRPDNPTQAEPRRWQALSGLPLKRFFHTSGQRYRALALAERLPATGEEGQLALLASGGMPVKRPLLIGEDFVLAGFRQEAWEARIK